MKKRFNSRLPGKRGLYLESAIIESRRPFNTNKTIPKEISVKRAKITVMGETNVPNIQNGLSIEVMKRKMLVGFIKLVGGKCRGTRSHHLFRYKVQNLVILPTN